MPKPVVVAVVYHPTDPSELERKYPDHLAKPGVAKLVKAAQAVYAGNVRGDVNGKRATRTAVFVFPSLKVWEKTAGDPEVQAVVADAQKIAGPGGVSILVGEVEAIKEVNVDPKAPHGETKPCKPGR